MNIILSKYAGFCPGVRRADTELQRLINSNENAEIYTLGDIIHNRIYNESLANKGVHSVKISDIESILENSKNKNVILAIRTHGIPKEEEEYLNSLKIDHPNFYIADLTCPYVKKYTQ